MKKVTRTYNEKTQATIDLTPKGEGYTTARIFPGQWAKYDEEVADGIISKKKGAQKKRNFGRAFTNAVKAEEYKNVEYTGKNSQKAATFRIF